MAKILELELRSLKLDEISLLGHLFRKYFVLSSFIMIQVLSAGHEVELHALFVLVVQAPLDRLLYISLSCVLISFVSCRTGHPFFLSQTLNCPFSVVVVVVRPQRFKVVSSELNILQAVSTPIPTIKNRINQSINALFSPFRTVGKLLTRSTNSIFLS